MKTTRLRVVLRGVEPAVARVIDVPASATLPELHELLQAAIGWTDSHLHQFITPEATYGIELHGLEVWPEDQRDETGAGLVDLGNRFEYLYAFGDGWTHDVEVLGPGGSAPGCVDGHGACPPEDCGGPGGYADLLDVLADPAHPEHDQMRTWVGNRLRPFDRATTDRWVRRMVGEVPERVRLLLDLTADGVRLTPGGRLPRTVVRSMQQHRPHWHPLGRPAATEDDLPPLARRQRTRTSAQSRSAFIRRAHAARVRAGAHRAPRLGPRRCRSAVFRHRRPERKSRIQLHAAPPSGYGESPLLDPSASCRAVLARGYETAMALVYGERPSFDDCINTIRAHAALL